MRLLHEPPTHSNTGPVPNADFNANPDFNADPDFKPDAEFNADPEFNADANANALVQGQSQIRSFGFGGTELITDGTSTPTTDTLVNMR